MFENSMWLFAVAGGPVILAAELIYAIMRRRRTRSEQVASDRKTKELYRRP